MAIIGMVTRMFANMFVIADKGQRYLHQKKRIKIDERMTRTMVKIPQKTFTS